MPALTPSRVGPWALVTGGSSGIGRAHAFELARRGFDVILVGRDAARLESTRLAIENETGVTAHAIRLDLSEDDSAPRLLDAVGDREVGVYVAVAGEGTPGDFTAVDVEEYLACVNLKVRTNLVVTHALARQMRARERGAILLVTSTGALQGVPGLASNAAAEAYLLALGEALHHELKPHGVTVTVLMPGPTSTPGLNAMVPDPTDYPPGTATPEATATQGVAALERGATTHIAGALNRAMLSSLPRRIRTRVMGRVVGSVLAAHARSTHAASAREAS